MTTFFLGGGERFLCSIGLGVTDFVNSSGSNSWGNSKPSYIREVRRYIACILAAARGRHPNGIRMRHTQNIA